MLKIAIIGGGSSYSPELVEGIINRYAQLPVTELALVDVAAGREKVQIIADLTRRMLQKTGWSRLRSACTLRWMRRFAARALC